MSVFVFVSIDLIFLFFSVSRSLWSDIAVIFLFFFVFVYVSVCLCVFLSLIFLFFLSKFAVGGGEYRMFVIPSETFHQVERCRVGWDFSIKAFFVCLSVCFISFEHSFLFVFSILLNKSVFCLFVCLFT
jgi:hypothetical protein